MRARLTSKTMSTFGIETIDACLSLFHVPKPSPTQLSSPARTFSPSPLPNRIGLHSPAPLPPHSLVTHVDSIEAEGPRHASTRTAAKNSAFFALPIVLRVDANETEGSRQGSAML